MKTYGFLLLGLSFLSLRADPIVEREGSGLRLIAYRSYVETSPFVEHVDDTHSIQHGPGCVRLVSSYLMNCGDAPITVPTFREEGGVIGSWQCFVPTFTKDGQLPNPSITLDVSQEPRCAMFFFHFEEEHGQKIIESPVKYQPVTLAPGEMTSLPRLHLKIWSYEAPYDPNPDHQRKIDEAFKKTMLRDAEVLDYVAFKIDPEVAARYGWWTGSLCVPVDMEKGRPNKLPLPTPANVTPAPVARVAPPSGAADR